MVLRKSDKALIRHGKFQCIIDRYGCVVNLPLLNEVKKSDVEDYIKFLEKLLPYLHD